MNIDCKNKNCTTISSSTSEAINHMKADHGFIDGGLSIQCIMPNCERQFAYSSSLKRHIKKHHIEFEVS